MNIFWVIGEWIKTAYLNAKDIRDELDSIYTILGLIPKMELEISAQLDIEVRYSGTRIKRKEVQTLIHFHGFTTLNKSIAVFTEHVVRDGALVMTGRTIQIPLSKIESVEITGLCMNNSAEKVEIKTMFGTFSKN